MVFELALILATLTCALVAGLLFAFAVVAMPGIARLGDAEFLRAFQVMDRVVQDRQPLFMLVWVGSVLALIGATALGASALAGQARALSFFACALWLLGVQTPTALVNIPLNNRVQALEIERATAAELAAARAEFEARWNRWNRVRTVLACVTTASLLWLLLRI